jgi:hypothetical protein
VSSFGRNDVSGKGTGNYRYGEGYGLKGTNDFGWLSSSGSFAALRMTAGTGNGKCDVAEEKLSREADFSTALLTKA